MTSSAQVLWSEVREALHERWPTITTEEIDAAGGDRTRLMALLEFKLGYGPTMAADEVDRVLATVPPPPWEPDAGGQKRRGFFERLFNRN
jgi:hypothetical protein